MKFCTSHYCLGFYVPAVAQKVVATRPYKQPCHTEFLHKLKPLIHYFLSVDGPGSQGFRWYLPFETFLSSLRTLLEHVRAALMNIFMFSNVNPQRIMT